MGQGLNDKIDRGQRGPAETALRGENDETFFFTNELHGIARFHCDTNAVTERRRGAGRTG